jgi:drug/metabolite transporter (DMT)-like permease
METPSTSRSSTAATSVFLAVCYATLFSTAGLIVRRIDLPPWDISFCRSICLLIALLPLLWWQRRSLLSDIRQAGLALLASATLLAGAFICFILALAMAPVANVLLVYGANPFLTALLARLWLGETLHGHTLATMAVAIVGLAISLAGSLQEGALPGMAMAFVVALCWSGNYIVVRRHRDVGMAPSIWLAGLISAVVALPFVDLGQLTWPKVPWLLALSPGQLVGGLLIYMATLKRIPAGRAALIGLLELVLGPLWVWLFDGEKPDDLTLVGGSIVIGAAAANVWLDSHRPAS